MINLTLQFLVVGKECSKGEKCDTGLPLTSLTSVSCSKQYGGTDVWGATYGGVAHRDECALLPAPLQGGCFWRFDWFRNADNPSVNWEKVTCPEQLSYVSSCRRADDPVPGEEKPTPTTSAPLASGTVSQGGQCGGKRYVGPTVCTPGTVCTFVDDGQCSKFHGL